MVGEAADAAAAVEGIRATEPDVVLLDVHLPGGGGRAVLEQVRAELPTVRWLALSVSDAAEDVIAVIPTAGLTFEAVHSGNQIGFAFDPSLVHLFDPETEQNLI